MCRGRSSLSLRQTGTGLGAMGGLSALAAGRGTQGAAEIRQFMLDGTLVRLMLAVCWLCLTCAGCHSCTPGSRARSIRTIRDISHYRCGRCSRRAKLISPSFPLLPCRRGPTAMAVAAEGRGKSSPLRPRKERRRRPCQARYWSRFPPSLEAGQQKRGRRTPRSHSSAPAIRLRRTAVGSSPRPTQASPPPKRTNFRKPCCRRSPIRERSPPVVPCCGRALGSAAE